MTHTRSRIHLTGPEAFEIQIDNKFVFFTKISILIEFAKDHQRFMSSAERRKQEKNFIDGQIAWDQETKNLRETNCVRKQSK